MRNPKQTAWLCAAVVVLFACTDQVALPTPATSSPLGRGTPHPVESQIVVADGVVTDNSLTIDCFHVWMWAEADGGATWVPVAIDSELVDTEWQIDGAEVFCGKAPADPPSYELPDALPSAWYVACDDATICSEPFWLD